jgi:hypothetical protein
LVCFNDMPDPYQYSGILPGADVPPVGLLNQINLGAQRQANLARIPGEASLEALSSADIAGLLNPPAMFPDVTRQAAEVTAGRGIGGSAAAYGTGLRMTDEERLRRMQLGQQMLSQATARNPAAPLVDPTRFVITPYQQAELDLQRYIANLRNLPQPGPVHVRYAGGLPSGAGGGWSAPAAPGGPLAPSAPFGDFGDLFGETQPVDWSGAFAPATPPMTDTTQFSYPWESPGETLGPEAPLTIPGAWSPDVDPWQQGVTGEWDLPEEDWTGEIPGEGDEYYG